MSCPSYLGTEAVREGRTERKTIVSKKVSEREQTVYLLVDVREHSNWNVEESFLALTCYVLSPLLHIHISIQHTPHCP